jgi:hypothetical protein
VPQVHTTRSSRHAVSELVPRHRFRMANLSRRSHPIVIQIQTRATYWTVARKVRTSVSYHPPIYSTRSSRGVAADSKLQRRSKPPDSSVRKHDQWRARWRDTTGARQSSHPRASFVANRTPKVRSFNKPPRSPRSPQRGTTAILSAARQDGIRIDPSGRDHASEAAVDIAVATFHYSVGVGRYDHDNDNGGSH